MSTKWNKATVRLWEMHKRASDRFHEITGESPRRPWHKQRLAKATYIYDLTLEDITQALERDLSDLCRDQAKAQAEVRKLMLNEH